MARKKNNKAKAKKEVVPTNDEVDADVTSETKNVGEVQGKDAVEEVEMAVSSTVDVDVDGGDEDDDEEENGEVVVDDVKDSVETAQDEKEEDVPEKAEDEDEEDDENDTTANRFVIVDSEDESEFEKDDRFLKKKDQKEINGGQGMAVKEAIPKTLNEVTEVKIPAEKDAEKEAEVKPQDKLDIGQQPYEPEIGGKIDAYESRGSAGQHDLAFITPTPLYKYTENKGLQEKLKEVTSNFVFGLAVVDFDHIKGPELTYWLDDEVIAAKEDQESELLKQKIRHYSKIWPYLAFQALPDGVHMYGETFTQFTLCYDELKKTDVELDFDLVDLVFDDDKKEGTIAKAKVAEQVEKGTETSAGSDTTDATEKGKANGVFVNVDLSASEQPGIGEASLERVRTRPVVEMEDPNQGVITLFGCACIRQLESALLKKTDKKNVKRSVVQKSVILLTRSPLPVQLREKLSIVTQSWFEQCDFSDCEILKALYVHISNTYNKHGYLIEDDDLYEVKNGGSSGTTVDEGCKIIKESDFYMGLNFQEVVRTLRRQLLVVFKCLILGKSRILFFSKDLNALSNTQYCLIGLISNLLLNLFDSGYPLSDSFLHEEKSKSQSLKSSDRSSILRFLGLPLRVFGFGAFFQPYLTLQQLSYITNINTKSFVVGSSNDIILEHKKEWFDVIVYLDEKETGLFGSGGCKVEVLNRGLKDILGLTWEDKRFIDYVIQSVDTHYVEEEKEEAEEEAGEAEEEEERVKSKTVNSNTSIDNGIYKGGDDFIRSQFEDYLIGFLSSVKYDDFLRREQRDDVVEQLRLDTVDNDVLRFNGRWVDAFRASQVYGHWNEITENELFNFFEPRHVGKDVGRTEASEPRFRGGAVFRSWISKWKDGARGAPAGAPPGAPAAAADKRDRDGDGPSARDKDDKGRRGEERDKRGVEDEDEDEEGENGDGDGPGCEAEAEGAGGRRGDAARLRTTMNSLGRDVGLFFQRIGDSTSATFAQYGRGEEEEEEEKEGRNDDDADGDAGDAGHSGDKREKGEIAGNGNRGEGPEEAPGPAGFENRLRGLFQWGRPGET